MDQVTRQERLDWVDTARGIGIILVVYGHALRGHVSSGAYDPAWHADLQDAVIYAFHMPLFFFLAGLFAKQSLRKGTEVFLRDKAITLVYPYFLWSIVSVALGIWAVGAVNHAIEGKAILTLGTTPVYQYWFLYALMMCQIITLITRGNPWITAILCVVSAIDIRLASFNMLAVMISYYLYFGLGILLAPYLPAMLQRRLIVIATVLAVLFFAGSFLTGDLSPDRTLIVGRAVAGIIATIGIAMLCASWSRWLAVLGTASMAIYVMHTIFSAGLRIGLRAAGFSHDLTALILGTVVGIAAPLAIWALARRYHLLPLLGFGTQPRNRQGRAE